MKEVVCEFLSICAFTHPGKVNLQEGVWIAGVIIDQHWWHVLQAEWQAHQEGRHDAQPFWAVD